MFLGLQLQFYANTKRKKATRPLEILCNLVHVICLMKNYLIERFSYDLEMKTREQNRNNKRTEIERFDWFIERIQTRVAFDWLREYSGEKTSCPRTF